MALSANLAVIERAIEKASRSLIRDFNEVEKLQISIKGPGDFVSRADKRSEEIIVESLLKDRPDWGIMAEEGTAHLGKEGYRFIIDPLDGTTNFLHGLPHWCVTIALEKDGEIIAGMTFDPIRQEMFRVEKNAGAFMNHTRLRVSGRKDLSNALIGFDYGLNDPTVQQKYYEAYGLILSEPGSTSREMGSAALTLAYIAAGRYDGCYMTGKLKPWDIAVGLLMVKESGGFATDLQMKPAHHEKGEILAANPALYKKLVEKLGLAA
jgi:myo-inositol-1(or 4)-monophosphatase